MRKAFLLALIALPAAQAAEAQQPLAITRVLLYKNGMAHIVRSGELTGPVSLTFHPEDMNDVLKSFTAWNPETNQLYSVGYTAGIPSSHMLSRFPFDIREPETGLGGFLMQVKGADLRLDHSGGDVEGKLVAIQQAERATAPQTTTSDYRMTLLLRDGALRTVWLGDVRSIEFADPQLRDQLRSYLEVMASGRQDVTREVSVYPVPAPGPIQVAYLQQFPLWKTSYRLDLGAKSSRIQGWAQIDNPTGEAWENVQVSLLSGAPVSFVMNLYDPLYTSRSTVAVPGGQVAAPRRYESAVTDTTELTVAGALGETERGSAEIDVITTRGGRGGGAGGGVAGGVPGGVPAVRASAPPPPPPAPAEARFQSADASRVEDFYEYTFPFPVRIASRQSALLPFLQRALNVEKLSIFNARTDRGNPRLGARIENTADIPFEAGPITFFQDSRYAGEAVLEYLPRGERALISYGVDFDVQIASRQDAKPETTARITVSKGIAVLYRESLATTTYEIRNKGSDSRTLVIEHPRFGNRELRGVEPFESTENFHRFRLTLAPGQATTLEVPEVVSRRTSITLRELTRPQLALFSGSETPAQVRQRIDQILAAQEQLATMQANVQVSQTLVDTLFRDQERLRENLKALGQTNQEQQLRGRYLEQLRRQEDQIEAARGEMERLNKDIAAVEARLDDLIATFTFGM